MNLEAFTAQGWRVLKSEAALIADSLDGTGFIGLVRGGE